MIYNRQYKWKSEGYGVINTSIDANIVGKSMEEIEEKYGEISAERLLEYARPEDSPIHDLFEYDDSVAAECWRRKQANVVIGCIVIVEESVSSSDETIETQIVEEEPRETIAFLNISTQRSGKGIYISTKKALSQEDTRQIVLQRALEDLRLFKRKYHYLSELSKVFEAIDDFTQESED